MKINANRKLTLPIVTASITIPLSIFVMVFWILALLQNAELSSKVGANTWLLTTGIISISIIIVAIFTLTIFLIREILEGRRQTRFVDSVTHELKSPLASLRLCVQTLSRRRLPLEDQEKLQRMMLDDIDRLSFFIDDILEASRLSNSPKNRIVSAFSLQDLIQSCMRRTIARHQLEENCIKIDISDDVFVETDKTAIEMVLRNLLDNAVKYSKDPVDVSVQVLIDPKNNEIFISVSDKGIGIPSNQLKRIFERFYRLPNEAVRERSGAGIGLYVAAQIIRNLGGILKAESAGDGQGSTFSFQLKGIAKTQQNNPIEAHE